MDVRMPDGTLIKNVPEGTTKAQLQAKLGKKQVNKPLGAVRSGLEGMTFGFADEIGLGAAALAAKATEGGDLSDIYGKMREQYNLEQGQFAQENPALAIGSTVAGGLLTAPLIGANAAKTAIASKSLMPLVKSGAVYGGVSGAGFAPTMGDVPLGVAAGTTLGAATPVAIQGLMRGAQGAVGAGKWAAGIPGRVARSVTQSGDDAVLQSSRQGAAKNIARAFQQDDVPLGTAMNELQALGRPGILADVGGENVSRLLQTTASLPGKTAQLAEKTLQGRMKNSVPRMLSALQKSMGTDASAFKSIKGLTKTALTNSRPFYETAHRELVTVSDDISELMSRPIMQQAYRKAVMRARSDPEWPAGIKIPGPNDLAPGKSVPLAALDWTKRALDSMYQKATSLTNPDRDLARIITANKRELLNNLDAKYPAFAQARSLYAGPTSVKTSINLGKKVLTTQPDEMADLIQDMSKADWDGYIIGAVDSIAEAMKKTPEGANAARKVASYAVRERIKQAFPSEDAFEQFMKAVNREDIFAQLRNVGIRGSQTQQRISTEVVTGLSAGTDLAQGRFYSVVMGKIAQFMNNYKHIPEPIRDEIGQMLLSDFSKTGKASQKLLTKLAKQQVRKDQIEKLIYSINAEATPGAIVGEQKALQ